MGRTARLQQTPRTHFDEHDGLRGTKQAPCVSASPSPSAARCYSRRDDNTSCLRSAELLRLAYFSTYLIISPLPAPLHASYRFSASERPSAFNSNLPIAPSHLIVHTCLPLLLTFITTLYYVPAHLVAGEEHHAAC